MENPFALSLVKARREATLAALRQTNELSERYGMSLTETQLVALADGAMEALRDTGRIEFGEGVLPKLIYAFCDSPYVDRQSYCDILLALQDAFYYFKNESEDAFSDDELVDAMKRVFDGEAQGSLEYLQSLSPEELYRAWREGEDGEWTRSRD